ncbi:MAG: MarR family transcriptional regulator, partial [Pseudomonadota bacterium]|nr:MarR family transcriptional regulator [Pseudomonadota bacterium]
MVKYKLEDQVGHLMRRANQRHAAIFFEGLNDQQLTPMQFAVLVKIGNEEEVSQNRLGRLAAMDPATVQGVVRRLKERALIDARPDPDDGRRSLWRLSEAGV